MERCAQGDNKGFLVCKKKMATSADLLCRYTPPAFRQFTEAVVNLKFDEEPRYSAYVPLFEPLCGPGPQRPILLEEKNLRVGQKRGREAFEGEDMEIVSLWLMPVIFCSLLTFVLIGALLATARQRQLWAGSRHVALQGVSSGSRLC